MNTMALAVLFFSEPKTSLAQEQGAEKRVTPNFVIIMADDMGYGDSSVYDGWIKMPHMERMAREGMKFTDFHSSGVVCSPTRAGLMTGRYQERAGVPGVINADPKLAVHHTGLQTSETTFAELLKAAGYRTAIFGKWHLGYSKKFNPTHHGFERFRGFVSGNIDYISHYDRVGTFDWWEGREKIEHEPDYLTHLITKHATKFIRDHKAEPFCLYVPHGAPHTPIQGPNSPPGRGPDKVRSKKGDRPKLVKEMMKALDESIGGVLDTLVEAGIDKNTFVIFLSDNGAAAHMRSDPLRGRKGQVWEGGHRVPAVAWWPGKIKAGTKSDQLCISLDLMPTMLDLAEVKTPDGLKFDGVSLRSVLLENRDIGPRKLFWKGQAMRDGNWKLVMEKKRPHLFNLADDLSEKNDLAAKHPDRVKEMMAALEAWRTDVSTGATPQPALEK